MKFTPRPEFTERDTVWVLRKARALVKRGWVRDKWAKDAAGRVVHYDSPEACAFCLLGAIFRAEAEYGNPTYALEPGGYDKARATYYPPNRWLEQALWHRMGQPYRSSLRLWHDAPERTQAEVLALLDLAIEEARGPV